MTEDKNKMFKVELDHENKVIRLGAFFYALKGVLICEATEEDKAKYYCNRFMTFPIVDESWTVREDDCIADGIEYLVIGKKGDTVLLSAIKDAADYNARERVCGYEDLLVNLEWQGITISNRKSLDSAEELPNNVVIEIAKVFGKNHFRLNSHLDSYFIPMRFFHVGSDDELYQDAGPGKKQTEYDYDRIVEQVAEDVHALSWFFHKPNLKVLVTSVSFEKGIGAIDKDWFYTVQTLEADINRRLERYYREYPDDYYKRKRPDICEHREAAMDAGLRAK